jgi:hypothetical protein
MKFVIVLSTRSSKHLSVPRLTTLSVSQTKYRRIMRCDISDSHGVSKKRNVFRDVAPCSLVETDRRFRGAYRFIIKAIAQMLETDPSILTLEDQ